MVEIEREGPVRRIRLDAGERNVLGIDTVRALRAAIEPDPDHPVIVLYGREDGFCSGLDNAVLAGPASERESLLCEMGELLVELLRGPSRVVAVCEGHAVAAGAMLLLVSDLRLGLVGDHSIGFTEPRFGMPLPELPVLLARQRLGRSRLHALTVLGETVGPAEAVEVGFLDRVHTEPAGLEAAVDRAAESLARLSDAAYLGSLASVSGRTIDALESILAAQRARRDEAR